MKKSFLYIKPDADENLCLIIRASLAGSICSTLQLFFVSFSQHEWRNRLSVCSKLCYAIGGAPYQITGSALGFFLQIYLLDVAQVSCWPPFYTSLDEPVAFTSDLYIVARHLNTTP